MTTKDEAIAAAHEIGLERPALGYLTTVILDYLQPQPTTDAATDSAETVQPE